MSAPDQTIARVRYEWRAGITDQSHRLTTLQAIDKLFGGFLFVVIMISNKRRCYAKMPRQHCCVSRILGGDQGHPLERVQGPL